MNDAVSGVSPQTETKGRILILDDEVELRAMLSRYLTGQGYTVRAVADAPQLDKLLSRERFDLLVLDLMMPGEDGLAVCRRLRAQGETIPILMLTARGELVDRVLGLEMGADDYLAKPFAPRELLARLQAEGRTERMIMITAYGSPENAVQALKAGAYDYLTKPVDPAQFRRVVASATGLQDGASKDAVSEDRQGRPAARPREHP